MSPLAVSSKSYQNATLTSESTIPLVSKERQLNVTYFYLAVPSTSYTYSYIKSVPFWTSSGHVNRFRSYITSKHFVVGISGILRLHL